MFFIKLYHFIFGYVTVKITGAKPEKFINMLINLRIKFWGLKKISSANISELQAKIPSRYAKKFIFDEIANKTHADYAIVLQKGIRFFIERRKHRFGIYTGAIIGILLIYFSTFFIWEVKIAKSDYTNNSEIIELLEKLGCKTGVWKKSLDIIEIQNRAVLASDGKISWLAVNIKGTVANIEIKKTEPSAEIIDTKTPANIIASKSGKITYIDTYDGQQTVKKDDTILKGDLLISGAVDSEMLGVVIKHASGKILAETTRIIEVIIPLDSTEKYYTGNIINKNSLNIFGKNINLYIKSNVPIKKYDKTKETKNIVLFNQVILPVKITTANYSEFTEKNIKLTENSAKDIAISKINCIIDNRFGGDENIVEIKSRNYEGEIYDGYYYMKCTVDCVENIAKEMPFEAH
ncbi:MAG: sporulation protein YqfD [Oscillospiraceae bacterium]|nr:sporulation protein YqfD [Oscillospiraceae bacterium]